MLRRSVAALTVATCAAHVAGQTFQRLGTCPTLGCVFPPDRTTFLAGQAFDIRLEVHAPVNGSEAYTNGVPDENFVLYIQKDGGEFKDAAKYFELEESPVERWNFSYYEDLFAEQDDQSTFVEVAAKAYRHIALYEPGNYTAKLQYYNGFETIAHWKVREPSGKRKAKNVIFFVGDGMATSAVTAARLIAHKSINGEYTSLLQLDEMEALGHQMTHSVDSFITDSANSATSLYTGKKASVNALNVYADSSPDPFDDPKFETIAEMAHRINCQKIGIVSTAYIADATPAALTAHTRRRADYPEIIDSFLNGVTANYSWTQFPGVDVLMGGGAENFQPCEDGCSSFKNQDYYQLFAERGYSVVQDKDELDGASTSEKLLGIFSTGNLDKWLDRNVFPENTRGNGNSPKNDGTDADNQPGLKAMTMKAIEVLSNRAKADGDKGFFLMSEAASIDKMHALDYDRALAELLELDDTVRATFAKLKELGELEDTLVVVTADHSHGFDVFGSVDKQYLAQADGDRAKRQAIGVYEQSGLSGYTVPRGVNPKNNTVVIGPQGPGFPVEWDPRYAIAPGFGGNPDRRENYTVHADGPRVPADEIEGLDAATDGNYVNPEDATNGFVVNGTLPVSNSQGVHSLADVSVYASGPGSEYFRGVYDSTGVFFRMADALNLGRTKNVTGGDEKH